MSSTPALSRQALREIAHELRSPLGGFEAMLDLLAKTPLTPEQARLVEALEASAGHLRAILGRILPPHAGEAREVPRLGALIAAIAASASARAEQKGLAFRLKLDPAIESEAEIDALGLRQVLENLIDNAIRVTDAGEIALTVMPGAAGRIAFRLSDSGPGLEPSEAEALMAGDPANPKRNRGLGLGIAARLVARGGGALRVEKAQASGTTFAFDWPLATGQTNGEGRLLIVDDHPASRLVLRTILGALGFVCAEATDPDSALMQLDEGRFAAVFTDLNMPDGGGRRLIAALAAKPERPALVVVSADDPREDEALVAQIDAAILKPLTVPSVVAVLRQLGIAPGAQRAA